MTPNPIPQSLDDLLDHAEDYANFKLRFRGRLPGTLFLLGPGSRCVRTAQPRR